MKRERPLAIKGIKDLWFPAPAFVSGGGIDIHDFVAKGGMMAPVTTSLALQRNLMNFRPRADWRLMVPHWLLLLVLAFSWSGLLVWRARRNRRASREIISDGR